MYYLQGAFSVTQYITHPISLAAFAIAAIMTYSIQRNANARKIIKTAREKDRAEAIIKTAERLHLDLSSVPQKDRATLIKQVLTNRIISQGIVACVIIVIGLCITYVVVKNHRPVNQVISAPEKKDSLPNNTQVDAAAKPSLHRDDSLKISPPISSQLKKEDREKPRFKKRVTLDSMTAEFVDSARYNGHAYLLYKITEGRANWEDVNRFISLIDGGTYMLTITNKDENRWLSINLFNRPDCKGHIPIGLRYQSGTKKFENIYSENQNDFYHWEDGQPDNDYEIEKYVHVMEKGSSRARRWNNIAAVNLPGYSEQNITDGKIFTAFILELDFGPSTQ